MISSYRRECGRHSVPQERPSHKLPRAQSHARQHHAGGSATDAPAARLQRRRVCPARAHLHEDAAGGV
eukprot:11011798-Alexandrium_andersonii.AAC.2